MSLYSEKWREEKWISAFGVFVLSDFISLTEDGMRALGGG